MGTAELAQKQRRLLQAFEATDPILNAITTKKAAFEARLKRLDRVHSSELSGERRRVIREFTEREFQDRTRVMSKAKKAHAVITQKVEAIQQRDRKDVLAFERFLDRAILAVERQTGILNEVVAEYDRLIVEADKILNA